MREKRIDITRRTNELVASLRAYTKSQAEDWKKVPELVSELTESGYIFDYNPLSRLWGVGDNVYVDLDSGELVSGYLSYHPQFKSLKRPADSESVLELALNLSYINARTVLKDLRRKKNGLC